NKMPIGAFTDVLAQVVGGQLVIKPGQWVQLVNNVTGTVYVATAAADLSGVVTFPAGVPSGYYTVWVGPTQAGPWTVTTDVRYLVPVVQGDDAALRSGTFSSGPYTPQTIPSVSTLNG